MKEFKVDILSRVRIRTLPGKPGVYLMKDPEGKILYVGKAKNLKARVRSYFAAGDDRHNVQFLLKKVHTIDTLVTHDERQALVLEADLIKKHKPRYNIRLKDDKAHYLVRVDLSQDWPRLELVRRVSNDGARYFGPFAFGYELRMMLEVIKRSIPLRSCSDKVLHNRVRPCLEFQIKRCVAPCCLEVDRAHYLHWVMQAIAILEGKNKAVITQLEGEMLRASKEERFEDAATIRDRLLVLKKVAADKPVTAVTFGARDAIGFYRDGANVEITVMKVRNGRLFGAKTFGFTDVEVPDVEVLSSFLSQYYIDGEEFPDDILISFLIDDIRVREELYSEKAGHRVNIIIPQKGKKAKFLSLAMSNANENFKARFSGIIGGESVFRVLKKELGLDEIPRTIECIDISHFQGAATVGSLVSFQDGLPEKSRYRRFHLTQEGKPDDFASIHEVVVRHLSRAAEENTTPDLLIIDGGPGQLSAALKARSELGLRSAPVIVSLAKKRGEERAYLLKKKTARREKELKPERVYVENNPVPIVLSTGSETLHLLERIRNEAHRFAVSFHRSTRSKQVFRSSLETIQGVGVKRRRELLREFGSVQAIRDSTPEELKSRCDIPEKLGRRIIMALRTRVE